jgi:hypothetical protein
MKTALPTDPFARELARRVSGDLEITLYWNPVDDSVSVEIYHFSTDVTIAVAVPPDRALDAFHHPFAHVAEPPAAAVFTEPVTPSGPHE